MVYARIDSINLDSFIYIMYISYNCQLNCQWWIIAALTSSFWALFACQAQHRLSGVARRHSVLTDNVSCSFLKRVNGLSKLKSDHRRQWKKNHGTAEPVVKHRVLGHNGRITFKQLLLSWKKKTTTHNLKLPTPRHWTPLTSSVRWRWWWWGFVRERLCQRKLMWLMWRSGGMRERPTLYAIPRTRILYPQAPWPQRFSLDLCFSPLVPSGRIPLALSHSLHVRVQCGGSATHSCTSHPVNSDCGDFQWTATKTKRLCLVNIDVLCTAPRVKLTHGAKGGVISFVCTDSKFSKQTEKLAMKSLPTAPTHTFYELSLPIGKWGRSKRGSTLCWSLLQRPKFPAWIITSVSKGAAALRYRMRFSSNSVWEVWKSLLTLKWTGRFYLRQPTHSRSFTTGGHGYTPLC